MADRLSVSIKPMALLAAFLIAMTCASLTMAQDTTADSPKKQKTRQLIQKYFPNLDQDSLNGWVDAYSSMPQAELIGLLQQRKLLEGNSGTPPAMKLNLPKFDLSSSAAQSESALENASQSPLQAAANIIRTNLRSSLTIGYRSQTVAFQSSGSENQSGSSVTLCRRWNLRAGIRRETHRKLDLAITNNDASMFRLEPGCVLTRAGHFQRLPDGTLGQMVNGKPLSLFPTVMVPEPTIPFDIAPDGRIETQGHDDSNQQVMMISAFRVRDAGALKSDDGVYFRVPEAGRNAVIHRDLSTRVLSGNLELSNVNFSDEEQVLNQLDRMLHQF